MGDVQGSSVQGVHHPGRKLSRCNYLEAVFLSGNCPRGNCPGGNCLRSNCPGENYLGDKCLGGNYPRWELSGVAIVLQ